MLRKRVEGATGNSNLRFYERDHRNFRHAADLGKDQRAISTTVPLRVRGPKPDKGEGLNSRGTPLAQLKLGTFYLT